MRVPISFEKFRYRHTERLSDASQHGQGTILPRADFQHRNVVLRHLCPLGHFALREAFRNSNAADLGAPIMPIGATIYLAQSLGYTSGGCQPWFADMEGPAVKRFVTAPSIPS